MPPALNLRKARGFSRSPHGLLFRFNVERIPLKRHLSLDVRGGAYRLCPPQR